MNKILRILGHHLDRNFCTEINGKKFGRLYDKSIINPILFFDIKNKTVQNENIIFENSGHIIRSQEMVNGLVFPKAKSIFFKNCCSNFLLNILNENIFPSATNVFIMHVNEPLNDKFWSQLGGDCLMHIDHKNYDSYAKLPEWKKYFSSKVVPITEAEFNKLILNYQPDTLKYVIN